MNLPLILTVYACQVSQSSLNFEVLPTRVRLFVSSELVV